MLENLDLNQLTQDYAIPWGIAFGKAIIVFVVGRLLAALILTITRKILRKTELDEMLVGFVLSILKFLLLLVVIIAALNELGVNTTSLVALIGAAGLAIGLALQGSLQNFSSGALLVLFRPISRGEFVEIAGVAGSVEEVRIFHTTLKTPDNKMIVVPNGQIYGAIITNYSRHPTRRVDMVFGIGYGDDIDEARSVIQKILEEDERVLADPAPVVALNELADSSVNFVVRPWAKQSDYWGLKWDVTEKVKKAFDARGIGIPYPQLDIHLHKPESAEG